MTDKNDFEYRYVAPSASERKEIESIKRNYLPKKKEESKINQLRKLDGKVKSIPQIASLVLGIVGTLIFGLGLSMVLEWSLTLWGVLVAAVGVVPIALAYPMFIKLDKKMKEKYGKQILDLSDELLNYEEGNRD